MKYGIEVVVNGRWESLPTEYDTFHDAVTEKGRLIKSGEATRGQIQVYEFWPTTK